MKTLKPYLLTLSLFLLTLIPMKTKAQDDPNVGFYADGVKVDKIDCYDFQDLKVVFLYNQEWSQYDYIKIRLHNGHPKAVKSGMGTVVEKAIPLSSINNYLKGKYIVYSIYGKDKSPIDMCARPYQGDILPTMQTKLPKKGDLKYDGAIKKGKPSDDNVLNVSLIGFTFKGVTEEFDESCNCIQKTKKYSYTDIDKGFSLLLTGRFTGGNKEISAETDLSNPCTYSGTKVDFNSLGKSGGTSNNSNSNSTNNAPVKTETPVKTSATNNAASNAAASALKPLDKKKPGYFVEKDGAQITSEGYKKGDALNGEVRNYTDGKIREVLMYVNGQKNGLSTTYFDNGQVDMTGNYKNDEKDGEWKFYNDSGKLKETKKFLNGDVQD